MSFFQHEQAIVETNRIGEGTRIWAFAHILPGAVIGENCNICDHTFIENDVVIGNRVTVKCGVQLWDGVRLEDDVFVGPNATFTNDHFPRSKKYLDKPLQTVVRAGASIGANATILPGITIGQHAMVGAGSVVTKDVPPYAIVAGNPAVIISYDSSVKGRFPVHNDLYEDVNIVDGVRLINLPLVKDLRGNLSVTDFGTDLPFIPKRVFWIFDVPTREVRGDHAHLITHQLLICLRGSCEVIVDNGKHRAQFVLERPNIGLYVPPLIWGGQHHYSADALLLVFASEPYDPNDYIRNYDEFRKTVGQGR